MPISASDARYMSDVRNHRLMRKFNDAITSRILAPDGPHGCVAFQEPEDDIAVLHEIAKTGGVSHQFVVSTAPR